MSLGTAFPTCSAVARCASPTFPNSSKIRHVNFRLFRLARQHLSKMKAKRETDASKQKKC
jgi:hypothetical protein